MLSSSVGAATFAASFRVITGRAVRRPSRSRHRSIVLSAVALRPPADAADAAAVAVGDGGTDAAAVAVDAVTVAAGVAAICAVAAASDDEAVAVAALERRPMVLSSAERWTERLSGCRW